MVTSTILDFDPPIPLVRELMREYSEQLGIDLCFQNFEQELADLPGRYAGPLGAISVAHVNLEPAGCGAYRPLDAEVCEMKRLYIRPLHRGVGLGRRMSVALMARAALAGYRSMRLDTLASMQPAVALYESLGFQRIAPYNNSPAEDCVHFEAFLPRV